ncbi:hypothetical protein NPIL_248161 [Nephila pilipes]|uniref:Uncharacterized protein n=1 Tax=Nephila pilipes TaxID=299642 RepID=A0A8X6TZ10_NEPPI|nr:hypothetical protein NPIL_248161 [Nephila pilipes]
MYDTHTQLYTRGAQSVIRKRLLQQQSHKSIGDSQSKAGTSLIFQSDFARGLPNTPRGNPKKNDADPSHQQFDALWPVVDAKGGPAVTMASETVYFRPKCRPDGDAVHRGERGRQLRPHLT